ncbi:MAG TPA: hypothetical protein VJH92_03715 [Candidatus Nanoarchaeia archaeon]|nr:hypothetical protein [Candidatus Nanoarchaeia archaeon]
MINLNHKERIAEIEEELKEKGIPNEILNTPEKMWKVVKKLEEAGMIKRKGYELAPPFERHYSSSQEPQQSYFWR